MEIKKPKEFVSLGTNRTEYVRVTDQIKALENFMPQYKDLLLKKMRIRSPYSMGKDIVEKSVQSGDIYLDIQVERRSSVPYQSIVDGWRTLLDGTNLLTDYRTITGVLKEDDKNYISCESALTDFQRIAYGKMNMALELNIKQATNGYLTDTIEVPEIAQLDTESAMAYFNGAVMLKSLKELSQTYKEEANEVAKVTGYNVIPVTRKMGIETGETEKRTISWANVVKSMIAMPSKRKTKNPKIGELESLANESRSFGERFEMFGNKYDLVKHNPHGNWMLYVGVDSLNDRLDYLVKENTEVIKVLKAENKEML